jgi:hypothetical protein
MNPGNISRSTNFSPVSTLIGKSYSRWRWYPHWNRLSTNTNLNTNLMSNKQRTMSKQEARERRNCKDGLARIVASCDILTFIIINHQTISSRHHCNIIIEYQLRYFDTVYTFPSELSLAYFLRLISSTIVSMLPSSFIKFLWMLCKDSNFYNSFSIDLFSSLLKMELKLLLLYFGSSHTHSVYNFLRVELFLALIGISGKSKLFLQAKILVFDLLVYDCIV